MKRNRFFLFFALFAVFAVTDAAAQNKGLTITGFPAYKAGEAPWQLFACTEAGAKNPQDLMTISRGFGDVGSNGTVTWISPPFSSSKEYFLYLVKGDGNMMVCSTILQLTNAGATVAFSSFADITQ